MKKLLVLGILMVGVMVLTGCYSEPSEQEKTEALEIRQTQDRLKTATRLPKLTNSLERENIKKRLETFDDPNKISYVYLVDFGRVMAFYIVKGKVSSGNKRLTTTNRLVSEDGEICNIGEKGCFLHNTTEVLAEGPSLDGTYGSSNPYIFFWTTEDVYVQWSGDYMLVDEPLQLTSQPQLIREIK